MLSRRSSPHQVVGRAHIHGQLFKKGLPWITRNCVSQWQKNESETTLVPFFSNWSERWGDMAWPKRRQKDKDNDKDIESDLVTETKSGSTEPGKWSRSRRWFCEAICSAATSCSIQSLCQCPCQIVIIDHFLLDEYYLKSVTDRIKIVVSLPTNQTITNNQSLNNKGPTSLDYIEALLTSWRQ